MIVPQAPREIRAALDSNVLRSLAAFGALTSFVVIVFSAAALAVNRTPMQTRMFAAQMVLASFLAGTAFAAFRGTIPARSANAATMLTQLAFIAFLGVIPIVFGTPQRSEFGMIVIVVMSFMYLSWPWAIAGTLISVGSLLVGELADGRPPTVSWVFTLAAVAAGSLIIHYQRYATATRVEVMRLDLEGRNAELVASQTKLTEAHEIAHIAGWERDLASDVISLSSHFSTVAGMRPQRQVTFDEFVLHIHPDDRAEFITRMEEGTKEGKPFTHDYRVVTSQGATRWLVSRVKIARDARGAFERAVGTIQDITDRKTSEVALHERTVLLGETQRVARIGSWTWDLRKDKVAWSDEHFRVFHRAIELGEPSYDEALLALAPESAARLDAAVRRTIGTGLPYEEDVELRLPEGRSAWMTSRGEAALDASGAIYGLRGTAQDITARKLAELEVVDRARFQVALRHVSESALALTSMASILQNAADLVATTLRAPYVKILELDPGGRTLTLRAAVGFSKDLIDHATVDTDEKSQAGYTLLRLEPVVVADSATETRFHDSTLLHDHGLVGGMSVAIQTQSGPFGVIGVHTGSPRRFESAEVDFLQGVATLVSNAIVRNRAETALRRSERLASLGTLVAGVAHEINNPLMYIHGSIDLIQRSMRKLSPGLTQPQALLGESIRNDADTAIRGLDRIGLITKGLRQVARASGGPRTIESMSAIAAGILPIAKPRMGANVEIVTDFRSVAEVECNATEISQVILNLLFNAADAMGAAGGVVRVATRDVRGHVIVDVEDAGGGIPIGKRHQIFTPFYTTKASGTGLGLSVSHSIVAEHGGELSFDSSTDVGTTFHVSLPATAPRPKLVMP